MRRHEDNSFGPCLMGIVGVSRSLSVGTIPPAHEAFGRPLGIASMGFGHVFFDGGECSFLGIAPVTGDALVVEEDFDGGVG